MTATSILKTWEETPHSDVKSVLFQTPDTADAADELTIVLADYGISPTGLLAVNGWVHTASGSVITREANTTAVTTGTLVVTIAGGTDNDVRVVEIVGRADPGVFV